METRDVIFARRSIRKYKSTPISDADLTDLLEAGIRAPSGTNLQPWYFVAIKSREKRDELIEIMGHVFGRVKPLLEERFAKHPEVVEETRYFLTGLGGAPVCILVFRLKDGYDFPDEVMQSVSAAIENILLAAADKGIGSCWLTAPRHYARELQERFAPGKGEFVAAVTLGYPDQTPKMPPRRDGRYVIV